MSNIVSKYKSNEHFQKRINITTFEEGVDDMLMEDDEDVLIFKDDKESEFYQFIKIVVTEIIPKELEVPHEEDRDDIHERTYGMCKKPFGILRTRAVEFLAQVF